METIGERLFSFYKTLKPPLDLPQGVQVLFPQKEPAVQDTIKKFLDKFYNDQTPRRFIVGINPGRFGAGITGVNFTAPRQLTDHCGIEHPFGNSSELSAEFIYEMIDLYGGVKKFYADYFLSSVCPLGFVEGGKNRNYYDTPLLQKAVRPFIHDCLNKQLAFNFKTDQCICIGGEKNYKFFSILNDERQKNGLLHFEKIIPLPHPRFILQYRRKHKEAYLTQYLQALK